MAVYFQKFRLSTKDVRGKKHESEHQAGLCLLKEALVREYQLCGINMESELSADSQGKPYLHAPKIEDLLTFDILDVSLSILFFKMFKIFFLF